MRATTYPIRAVTPGRLAIVARPRGGDWRCDEITALAREGIDVIVSMLTSDETKELGLCGEAEECQAANLTFVNIPLLDRSVPQNTDDFLRRVEFIAELVRAGRSVGVHCRASIGRASIFAVSVLVRLGWETAQAFEAVEAARGCSIPDTPEQRRWVLDNVLGSLGVR